MQTFVFDADGVVCVAGSFTAALEREHHICRDRLASFFAGPFSECILGRLDLKEAVAPRLAEWGWRKSADEFLTFWFQQEHAVCPAALSTVQVLRGKGHRCVLATNQEKYRTAYLRREMRLAEEFDHIFASCELGTRKPDPMFFSCIGARLQQPPGDIWLIDDSEANVAGARAAGWNALWYHGTKDLAAIEAEGAEAHRGSIEEPRNH